VSASKGSGRRPLRHITIASLLALLPVSACSGTEADGVQDGGSAELTVFAASSLTQGFQAIAADFEAQHPGVTVTFNFWPSDGLAAQVASEGGADVFASASAAWMDEVAETAGVTGRTDFVSNELVIITPPDDPAGVDDLVDLAGGGVQVVIAAEGVPAGDYARDVLKLAGIEHPVMANVVSNAEDDAAVVATIASGEADAGIVYRSDVTAAVASDVRSVEIPEAVNVVADYPIAVVEGSDDAELGREWVEFVSTGDGATRLTEEFGFLPSA
jgi:molybdate transport system substrate-binding protein